jgi:hypothetical protein
MAGGGLGTPVLGVGVVEATAASSVAGGVDASARTKLPPTVPVDGCASDTYSIAIL